MKRIFIIFFLFVSFVDSIYSQEDSLHNDQEHLASDLLNCSFEELLNVKVIGVSKKYESIEQSPGVVSIISSHEIENYGANNLIDILQQARCNDFDPFFDLQTLSLCL